MLDPPLRHTKEVLRLIVNGESYVVGKTPPRVIMQALLLAIVDAYSPPEAICQSLKSMIAIVADINANLDGADIERKVEWRRFSGGFIKRLDPIFKCKDSRQTQILLWDYLLSLERLGRGGSGK